MENDNDEIQIVLTKEQALQTLYALGDRIETMVGYQNDAALVVFQTAAMGAYKTIKRAI